MRRSTPPYKPTGPSSPEFVFDDRQADPEFAAVVRAAVEKFDFADLPSIEQTTYKVMRREGAAVALAKLRMAMEAVRADHPGNTYAQLGDIIWQLTTGELVFKLFSDADRLRFFPQNDFASFRTGIGSLSSVRH